MEYREALSYINDKNKFGSRLGLDSIGKLLDLLGNPQNKLKYIHVAGTNGKGSTSSYLAHCIREAGYKVGLFTSPYLERFNERIQINGQDIPDEDLGRITSLIKEAADKMVDLGWEHPTTFEIITAIAFLYFSEERPDYVILEVGLGGRYDATNIIDSSLASVITTIDYDHINELGDSLDKIAYEKAGIIKEKGLVISYPQKELALSVLDEVASKKGAELFISPDISIEDISEQGSVFNYSFQTSRLNRLKINMLGEYQAHNAALAVTTLLVLRDKGLIHISNEKIRRGLEKAQWAGRLELLRRDPLFIIDGAHNLQGINNLAKALTLFNYRKLILGVGILKDKDVDSMLKALIPLADKVIVTEVDMPRKLNAELLAEKIEKYKKDIYIEKDIKKAINKSFQLADKEDLILFGGSLYLIGQVRSLVKLL